MQEGLRQLKRVFGDDVITQENDTQMGPVYVIHFPFVDAPGEEPQYSNAYHTFGNGDDEQADFNGIGQGLTTKLFEDPDVRPNVTAEYFLNDMLPIAAGAIQALDTQSQGLIFIKADAANNPMFLSKIGKLEDQYFHYLQNVKPVVHAKPQENEASIRSQILNMLDEKSSLLKTRWKIDIVSGTTAYVTENPIPNAAKVAFYIMDKLKGPTMAAQRLSAAGYAVIPVDDIKPGMLGRLREDVSAGGISRATKIAI